MPFTAKSPAIAYETAGDSGSPVLLIMGFGMRAVVWKPQFEFLSRHHRVARFDNRGVGDSKAEPGRWRMHHLADDALGVLDALEWSTAHVVGVSMGGMVAQELALRAPRRLRSLSLIATHPGGPFAALPTARGLRWFVRANTGGPSERVHALQRLLYTESFLNRVERGSLEARMRDMVGVRAPRATLLSQLHAVLRHDTRARLGRVRAPTLVIRPDEDVLVRPASSDALSAAIPGARLEPLQAGHGLTFEAAESLNQLLLEHFARADDRSSERDRRVA